MKNLSNLKNNFIEIFSNKIYISLFSIVLISMGYIFYYFTNIDSNIGILGLNFVIFEITLEILISLLFAVFIPISIYKFNKFNSISFKENIAGTTGSFLGILVVGCPACSITIASYVGLGGFISLIPGYGLGLKAIAIPMLIYSNYSNLKDLNTCKIKK